MWLSLGVFMVVIGLINAWTSEFASASFVTGWVLVSMGVPVVVVRVCMWWNNRSVRWWRE